MMFRLTTAMLLLSADLLSGPAVAADEGKAETAQQLPRVVSINLCTDQLVMALADPEQIVALSSLSHDAAGSFFYQQARLYPKVESLAEQLLPLAPDLVVTGPFTSRYTLSLLEELGVRVEVLPIANSIEEMVGNVQRTGELLSRQRQAIDMVDIIRQRLRDIQAKVDALRESANRRVANARVAVFDTNGYTVGNKTMRGQAIELSGWKNVATEQGIEDYGVLGLEQLIELAPQALIESPYSDGTYSRGQMLTRHPAIREAGLDPKIIRIPSNQTICAGPWTVDVVERLLAARTEL